MCKRLGRRRHFRLDVASGLRARIASGRGKAGAGAPGRRGAPGARQELDGAGWSKGPWGRNCPATTMPGKDTGIQVREAASVPRLCFCSFIGGKLVYWEKTEAP